MSGIARVCRALVQRGETPISPRYLDRCDMFPVHRFRGFDFFKRRTIPHEAKMTRAGESRCSNCGESRPISMVHCPICQSLNRSDRTVRVDPPPDGPPSPEVDLDGCDGKLVFVNIWCPECDCDQSCLVISKYSAECSCGEIITRD